MDKNTVIKKLSQENAALKLENRNLKVENENLKSMVDALKSMNQLSFKVVAGKPIQFESTQSEEFQKYKEMVKDYIKTNYDLDLPDF